MARRYKPDSRVSFRLEEPVDLGEWHILGTPAWFQAAFPEEYRSRNPERFVPVSEAADVQEVVKLLRPARSLNIDTETSGPRALDGLDAVSPTSRILLFQIGAQTAPNCERTFIVEPQLIPEFRELIEGEQWVKILQNAVHDYRFLASKCGLSLVNIWCTMLAEQLLTAGEEGVGVSLADLVRKYKPYRIISKNVREEFICHSGVFTAQQLFYAARDIFLLRPVAVEQANALFQKGMLRVANLEFENIAATAEMGLTGVELLEEFLRETLEYNLGKRAAAEQQVFEIYNAELAKSGAQEYDLFGPVWETFKLSSAPEKKAAFARLGLDLESTDTDALKETEHPIVKPMIAWSGYNKVVSNYGETMIAKIHWHTKRFHPDFDQLGAGESAQRAGRDKKETIATGRYSSNFQQLPRPEKILEPLSGAELDRVRSYFASLLSTIEGSQKAA